MAHLLKPQTHLISLLKSMHSQAPAYTLFLGAGASTSSGVKSAKAMIGDWRTRHHGIHGKGSTLEDHLKACKWHQSPDEYSQLFEILFDHPSQRRDYIEGCIEKSFPSWGYIYLVNLLRKNIFNTIITTNFDDLINEACHTFSSEVRPIVCAHDSSISSVRLTSRRPKIIKLHGDFLFDNIKNTVRELETLEENSRSKLRQFAAEFGMVVVGYSGHDRSVMDTIDLLLRSEDNFPHGIYWCVRAKTILSPAVDRLARFPRFHLVEIEGFDELIAEIHEAMAFDLQPEVADPYSALATRLNTLVSRVGLSDMKSHKLIERDLQRLSTKVAERSQAADQMTVDPTKEHEFKVKIGSKGILTATIPFRFLAESARRRGNLADAELYIRRQLSVKPELDAFDTAFSIASEVAERTQFVADIMTELERNKALLAQQPARTFNYSLRLIECKEYEYAEKVLDLGYQLATSDGHKSVWYPEVYYWINKAQILRQQGKSVPQSLVDRLLKELPGVDTVSAFGIKVVLEDFGGAESLLKMLPETSDQVTSQLEVWSWPIARLLEGHMQDVQLRNRLNTLSKKQGSLPASTIHDSDATSKKRQVKQKAVPGQATATPKPRPRRKSVASTL